MRTTLILRDDLVERAAAMTGIHDKTALVHAGLEALAAWRVWVEPTGERAPADAGAPRGPRADYLALVDTSVWIDHLRASSTALARLLERGEVLCHPAVIGELACGSLRQRRQTLALLTLLPRTTVATDGEFWLRSRCNGYLAADSVG